MSTPAHPAPILTPRDGPLPIRLTIGNGYTRHSLAEAKAIIADLARQIAECEQLWDGEVATIGGFIHGKGDYEDVATFDQGRLLARLPIAQGGGRSMNTAEAVELNIIVIGTPGPQGSKRFLGMRGGKGILVESSAKVKPWREAVKWAVLEVRNRLKPNHTVTGPIDMQITFTFARPKKYAAAKHRGVPHSTRPDLSKLVRSTEDALTDAGAWEDDARVVRCLACKVYPGQHPDALDVPGAVIKIRRIA